MVTPKTRVPYSVAEEVASTSVQAVGTLLAISGLVVLIHLATLQGGATAVASVAVYGSSLILAFLASTLYHGSCFVPWAWGAAAEKLLRTVDHCTIYLLIAGTYTPLVLLVLWDSAGWVLLTAVWTIALTGVVLRVFWSRRLLKLRVGLYIALGWLVTPWIKPVYEGLGPGGTTLLVAGGLTYSLGVGIYRWRGLPFHEAIWHGFVVAASACFFAAIAFYALPAGIP